MPTTLKRGKIINENCIALIFTSVIFAFRTAAGSYAGYHSFLKVAIIPAILLAIFTIIFFSGKNFYNRLKAQKLVLGPFRKF
jgi:hypothetical protein